LVPAFRPGLPRRHHPLIRRPAAPPRMFFFSASMQLLLKDALFGDAISTAKRMGAATAESPTALFRE
jgi:hypothetical protein